MDYTPSVDRLIPELGAAGHRSQIRPAPRLALIKVPVQEAETLAQVIVEARQKVRSCRRCFNLSEGELCRFCRDDRRDRTIICVVEEAKDIVPLERTGEFHGLYHVLGALSPIDGVGPSSCASGSFTRSWRRERRS